MGNLLNRTYDKETTDFVNSVELNVLEMTAYTQNTDGYIIENGMVTGIQIKL